MSKTSFSPVYREIISSRIKLYRTSNFLLLNKQDKFYKCNIKCSSQLYLKNMSGKLTNMHNFSTLTGATGQLLNQTLFYFSYIFNTWWTRGYAYISFKKKTAFIIYNYIFSSFFIFYFCIVVIRKSITVKSFVQLFCTYFTTVNIKECV